MFKMVLDGILMSSADTIPGVSGSTVAFILGFYDKFIKSLHDCVNRDKKLRREGIFYILKLLPGFTIGMVLSVLILAAVIENHCYFLSSMFMGLTIASIPFMIFQEKETLRGHYQYLLLTLLGVLLSIGMYFIKYVFQVTVVDFHVLQPGQYFYIFVVNAFGMASMLLPGMSGSSLLLILGVYTPMITAANDLLKLDFSVLPGLATAVGGMLLGSALSIKSVKDFIEKHRCAAMYLILGFIAGSTYAIIKAPTIRAVPLPQLTLKTFNFLAFVIGACFLALLEVGKFLYWKAEQKKEELKQLLLKVEKKQPEETDDDPAEKTDDTQMEINNKD